MTSAPVSVVVPTVGRRELLRACLRSIHECDPHADEVLVVDQSGDPTLSELVGPARLIRCDGSGVARAVNLGLEAASHPVVLITHDDCTVGREWVGAGATLA